MRFPPKDCGNRREFFRTALRYGLAGALTIVASLVRGGRAGQGCVNKGLCASCGAFETCGLPSALSAKQVRDVSMGRRNQLGG
jgi:hypothetical protein